MVRTKGWLLFIYEGLTAILFTFLLWRGFISVEVRKLCLNWVCQERKILNQARYVNLFSLGNCHWSLREGKITFPQTSKWSLLIQHADKSLIHGCAYCVFMPHCSFLWAQYTFVQSPTSYVKPYSDLIEKEVGYQVQFFHLRGPSYPSLGRVCAAELFPW